MADSGCGTAGTLGGISTTDQQMNRADLSSTRGKVAGIALILLVGLLNFHLPHFLLERGPGAGDAANLEFVYLANLLGAVIAALAVGRDRRWGWWLGIVIVGLSFALYLAQETVGLPGLPQNWWEPSRIVSVLVEASFILVARNRLVSGGKTSGRPTDA